jgi:hypothetical protein
MIRNRLITILAHFLLGFFRNDFDPSRFMMEGRILGRAPGIATMKGSGMLAIGLEFDGEGIVTTKSGATRGRGRGRHHGWNWSKARG